MSLKTDLQALSADFRSLCERHPDPHAEFVISGKLDGSRLEARIRDGVVGLFGIAGPADPMEAARLVKRGGLLLSYVPAAVVDRRPGVGDAIRCLADPMDRWLLLLVVTQPQRRSVEVLTPTTCKVTIASVAEVSKGAVDVLLNRLMETTDDFADGLWQSRVLPSAPAKAKGGRPPIPMHKKQALLVEYEDGKLQGRWTTQAEFAAYKKKGESTISDWLKSARVSEKRPEN